MPADAIAAERDAPDDVLVKAERHFDFAIELFQRMTNRIHEGDAVTQTEADRTARALHAATQTLFNIKKRLHDDNKREKGIVNDYAVDLECARDDVRKRLDRIRSARSSG